MASENESTGPQQPPNYTALYDDQGGAYLVPDFLLPAAKVAASAEYNKHEIEKSRATGGVSHFPIYAPQLQLVLRLPCGIKCGIGCNFHFSFCAAPSAASSAASVATSTSASVRLPARHQLRHQLQWK